MLNCFHLFFEIIIIRSIKFLKFLLNTSNFFQKIKKAPRTVVSIADSPLPDPVSSPLSAPVASNLPVTDQEAAALPLPAPAQAKREEFPFCIFLYLSS